MDEKLKPIDYKFFENIVSDFLTANLDPYRFAFENSNYCDFTVEIAPNHFLCIEVKVRIPDNSIIRKIRTISDSINYENFEFILLTPQPPSPKELEYFNKIFSDYKTKARWLDLNGLAKVIGAQDGIDIYSNKYLNEIKAKSLSKKISSYINSDRDSESSIDTASKVEIANQKVLFSRQFSFKAISNFPDSNEKLLEKLKIGERTSQVTVVLSDIKSFSEIVSESLPDDLTEMMSKYYRRAREAVFANSGMLDKFIGDAVLAVFGYPEPDEHSAINAIKFSNQLIDIGQEILNDWSNQINAIVPSGTRIGIATGDIWPINIGAENIEISLLGDTINLAARLEKNSNTNSFLMDNRTMNIARKQSSEFINELNLVERTIEPELAKGQRHNIQCWMPLPPEQISTLSAQ